MEGRVMVQCEEVVCEKLLNETLALKIVEKSTQFVLL